MMKNIRVLSYLNEKEMQNIRRFVLPTDVRPLYPRLLAKSDFVYDYPEDWIGLRVRNKGKITDIYINQLADGRLIHSNSWIEADGWFTDAYMFTVTYEEGTNPADSKELFICYGSGLRRDKTSYFSSLSKLFVIQKEENKQLKMWIEGRSKINANFRSERHPSSVTVNDKVIPTIYEHFIVKVKQ